MIGGRWWVPWLWLSPGAGAHRGVPGLSGSRHGAPQLHGRELIRVGGLRQLPVHHRESAAGHTKVDAMVDVVELTGNEILMYVLVGEKSVLARVGPRTQVRPGQSIGLAFVRPSAACACSTRRRSWRSAGRGCNGSSAAARDQAPVILSGSSSRRNSSSGMSSRSRATSNTVRPEAAASFTISAARS